MKNDPTAPSAPASCRMYRIRVRGCLERKWGERLAGMHIAVGGESDGQPTVVLSGPLRDEAELQGVLNTLYELRLPILNVERQEAG